MPEYAWMCLIKQDSKYAWGPKYARILKMVKFWIWLYEFFNMQALRSILNMPEYAFIEF